MILKLKVESIVWIHQRACVCPRFASLVEMRPLAQVQNLILTGNRLVLWPSEERTQSCRDTFSDTAFSSFLLINSESDLLE